MPSEAALEPARARVLPRRADARAALGLASVYVVVVVAVPLGWWRVLGSLALVLAFVIGWLGVAARALFRRWLGLLLVVAFFAGTAAAANPERARLGLAATALAMAAKSALAAAAMLTLTSAYSFTNVLAAIRRLGAPAVFVDGLYFMERYRHLLAQELARMTTARRARTFGRSSLSWTVLTGLLGGLLLRTLERSLRVHDAMLCRGWTGEPRDLDS